MDPVLAEVSSPSLAGIVVVVECCHCCCCFFFWEKHFFSSSLLLLLWCQQWRTRTDQLRHIIAPRQPHIPRSVRMGQRRHARRAHVARGGQVGAFTGEGALCEKPAQFVVGRVGSVRSLGMEVGYPDILFVLVGSAEFPEGVQGQVFVSLLMMLADVIGCVSQRCVIQWKGMPDGGDRDVRFVQRRIHEGELFLDNLPDPRFVVRALGE
mmetsp:Transcript_31230/g.66076  ORF Transcript_31230/g.66076 Transcript_31230/m.66076 type:complete len:209 (-) Transcript_31230:772-1398(-)